MPLVISAPAFGLGSVHIPVKSANRMTNGETLERILSILPGPVPPQKNKLLEKVYYLSDGLAGDVILPVWWRTPQDADSRLGPSSYPVYSIGTFDFHFCLLFKWPALLRPLVRLFFTLYTGLRLHWSGKRYGVIMTYGNTLTALCGLILKWMTGAKLIVEIPGVPHQAYLFESPRLSSANRVKKLLSDLCLQLVVRGSDRVKLLYPSQLEKYPSLQNIPSSVFHDFVPVSSIKVASVDNHYVLLLGTPWYRKGVDIIVDAYRAIADKVPNYKLKIVGYFPEAENLFASIRDCPAIEILDPVNYEKALELISGCSILALPSRSEAMGRVLLEGMAARKPLIGSNVDGIPFYIRDGINGLIFKSEDRQQLGDCLLRLLTDPKLAKTLGENGFKYVHSALSEKAYAEKFRTMIAETLKRSY